MNAFLDRYDLSPFERRLAVFLVVAFFLVFNMILVWPRFGEWGEIQEKNEKANQSLQSYQKQLDKRSDLEKRLAELKRLGSDVLPDERGSQLVELIQQKARQSNMNNINIQPSRARPSPRGRMPESKERFFEQKFYSLNAEADTKDVVDFLLAIANEDLVVRVHNLELTPRNHLLRCKMLLVANYQLQPSEEAGVEKRR